MESPSLRNLRVAVVCALVWTGAANAYYPSITIDPGPYAVGDTVTVKVEGLIGNSLCWALDSSSAVLAGDTLRFRIYLSNGDGGACPQTCLAEAYNYVLTEDASYTATGMKRIEVYERNEDICFARVDEINIASEFAVGNPACFSCIAGDANNDGSTNIVDVTFLIAYIFSSGPSPPCPAEADANGNGDVNIADVTELVAYIFSNGSLAPCEY